MRKEAAAVTYLLFVSDLMVRQKGSAFPTVLRVHGEL
jgi:hypothetical protein